jgi:hypothetical protein
MRYKLQIPCANRTDLLEKAIDSSRDIGNTHVWLDGISIPFDKPDVTWHVLPPMPSTSVYNMFIQDSWDDDVMFHMHNDAYLEPGVAAGFFKHVHNLFETNPKWGVVFTNYDILCAFNMKAVRDVGYWDTMFFQYSADIDYYHRMRVHDWHILEFPRDGVIHGLDTGGSSTVKSDPVYNYRVQWRQRTHFDKDYFMLKWGTPMPLYKEYTDNTRKPPGFPKEFGNFNPAQQRRDAQQRALMRHMRPPGGTRA